MAAKPHFLLSSLFALALLQVTLAYHFAAINNASSTPGGRRFDKEIGIAYTVKTMPKIADFIWKVFRQNTADEKRHYPDANDVINVIIQEFEDDALGRTIANNVYMSALGIKQYSGNPKTFFTMILYHETGHIFQWSGEGTAPGGLTEGIADYIVLKSPYSVPGYSTPGEGEKWDEGYGTTSRFLEYCDSLREGFTPELNKMMRKVYKEEYFEVLLGKPVDQLWKEYKAKYSKSPPLMY